MKDTTRRRETAKHHAAFEAWYAAGRSCRNLPDLAVPERTLRQWAAWFVWHQLADARDAEAREIANRRAIQEQAQRIEAQRKAGTLLRTRAIQVLAHPDFKFTSEDAVIRALKVGIDIERQCDGLPTAVLDILNADDDELRRRLAEMDARRCAVLALSPKTSIYED